MGWLACGGRSVSRLVGNDLLVVVGWLVMRGSCWLVGWLVGGFVGNWLVGYRGLVGSGLFGLLVVVCAIWLAIFGAVVRWLVGCLLGW